MSQSSSGVIMLVLVCLCAYLSVVEGTFDIFDNKVCYDVIGCFDNNAPFTNSWHELPDSPDKVGVNLTLYTLTGPKEGEVLNFKVAKSVLKTHFDLHANTKIIIHGYMNDGTEDWNVNMRKAFLKVDAFNVITVAWGPGAHVIYPKAVANTRVIGAVIAHLLTSLKEEYNVSMNSVHLLGHSLGAHISGYVGSAVGGIARISGMDPAGPLFESTDIAVRIDPSDGDFVDCIHSDGLPLEDMGFGTMSAWCDVDFYPNGAGLQPGCPQPVSHILGDVFSLKMMDAENTVSCSHSRSHNLYIDSIENCRFLSSPCDNYQEFQEGKCTCTIGDNCVSMGYHAADKAPRASGKYFLHTTGSEPFC